MPRTSARRCNARSTPHGRVPHCPIKLAPLDLHPLQQQPGALSLAHHGGRAGAAFQPKLDARRIDAGQPQADVGMRRGGDELPDTVALAGNMEATSRRCRIAPVTLEPPIPQTPNPFGIEDKSARCATQLAQYEMACGIAVGASSRGCANPPPARAAQWSIERELRINDQIVASRALKAQEMDNDLESPSNVQSP